MPDRMVTVRLKVQDDFSVTVDRYSQKMGQAEQSTRKLETTSRGMAQSLKGLDSQFQTLFGGIAFGVGVGAVKSLAENLYSTGMAATRVEAMFNTFEDRIGNTAEVMDRLRTVSRGAATDMALMGGANQLLNMNLVQNADQLEKFIEIAATFSQAMGTDMAGSLEQFAMIMTNQSYLRLDALGIGAGDVRALAEGYRAAGMDSAEAFNQAFLEVASEKLPQMAEVADASVTALQRFQVAVDNWWADFGERFATGVTGMIGLIDLLIRKIGEIPATGPDTMTVPGGEISTNFGTFDVPDMIIQGDAIFTVPGMTAEEMALNDQTQAEIRAYQARQSSGMNVREMMGGYGAYAPDMAQAARMAESHARNAAYRALAEALGSSGIGGVGDLRSLGYMRQMAGMQPYEQAIGANAGHILEMSRRQGGLFSADDVYQAQQWLDVMNDARDTLENMGASETVLNQMDLMITSSEEWKTNIDEGASRLENLNLAGLFGQTSGGRLAEIDTAILSQMEAMGASDETMEAITRALGLDSGQLTAASLQFEEEIAPQLAQLGLQWGADTVATARRAYEEGLTSQAAAGQAGQEIDFASILGASTGLQYFGWEGGGGGGESIQIKPGDTVSALAAARNMTVSAFASKFGITNPNRIYAGQTLTARGGGEAGGFFAPASFDMLEMSMLSPEGQAGENARQFATDLQTNIESGLTSAVDTFSVLLDQLSGKTVRIPVEFFITNPGVFGALLGMAVNNNGGITPGSQSGGRSTTHNQNRGHTWIPE